MENLDEFKDILIEFDSEVDSIRTSEKALLRSAKNFFDNGSYKDSLDIYLKISYSKRISSDIRDAIEKNINIITSLIEFKKYKPQHYLDEDNSLYAKQPENTFNYSVNNLNHDFSLFIKSQLIQKQLSNEEKDFSYIDIEKKLDNYQNFTTDTKLIFNESLLNSLKDPLDLKPINKYKNKIVEANDNKIEKENQNIKTQTNNSRILNKDIKGDLNKKISSENLLISKGNIIPELNIDQQLDKLKSFNELQTSVFNKKSDLNNNEINLLKQIIEKENLNNIEKNLSSSKSNTYENHLKTENNFTLRKSFFQEIEQEAKNVSKSYENNKNIQSNTETNKTQNTHPLNYNQSTLNNKSNTPNNKNKKQLKKTVSLTYNFKNLFNNRFYKKYRNMLNEAASLVDKHELDDALDLYYVVQSQNIPSSFKKMIKKNIEDIESTITNTFLLSNTIVQVDDKGEIHDLEDNE